MIEILMVYLDYTIDLWGKYEKWVKIYVEYFKKFRDKKQIFAKHVQKTERIN